MKKRVRNTLIVVGGLLIILYIGIAAFFSSHFLPGTVLNGEDVSGMTIDEVKDMIRKEASGYVLNLTGRGDLTDSVTAKDISLEPEFDDSLESYLGIGNGFCWPAALLFSRNYATESVATYSEEQLKSVMQDLVFMKEENISQPVDAAIDFDEASAKYVITKEDNGTAPDEDALLTALEKAVSTMQDTMDLSKTECYVKPKITSDNEKLQALLSSMNQYAAAKITYTFGDDVVTVDGSTIKDWLTVKGTNVTLDEDAVSEYVNTLARKYDTFGKDRTFTNHNGEQITVSGGDYGWWMDRDSTAEELTEAIKNAKETELTPVYFATASSYGTNDYGTSYVEVDLDEQHVYVYKDGKLVTDTDCVSGKATKDRMTPDGTYSITYKEKDATLVGENYESAVKYWMPFNGNIGLHDASWRSSFGGDIYMTSGSHGCVNLPSDAAAKVFESVEKGEAVIVYGGLNPDEAKVYLKKKANGELDDSAASSSSAAGASNASASSAASAAPASSAAQSTAPAAASSATAAQTSAAATAAQTTAAQTTTTVQTTAPAATASAAGASN